MPRSKNKSKLEFSLLGQSLIEILIASALGALMITAAATIIAPALRISGQTSRAHVGTALAKELLENVRVWGEGSWHNITNLSTTSAYHYYLNTSSSPFVAVAGEESIFVSSTTFTRYFYVENVQRNSSDEIVVSGGSYDPSTKKVVVQYSWPTSATNTMLQYVTRNRNNILHQTDWSGGPGQEGPISSTNRWFSTSTPKINYSSTSGSIYLNL